MDSDFHFKIRFEANQSWGGVYERANHITYYYYYLLFNMPNCPGLKKQKHIGTYMFSSCPLPT